MKIARQPHGFASTRLNGKTYPQHKTLKNHPPADKTSSGRVIDVMGGRSPAPSLRELSSECETEGVSSVEWERLTIQSFVGAMKIARNPTVSQVPG